jgi:hypothetical protein
MKVAHGTDIFAHSFHEFGEVLGDQRVTVWDVVIVVGEGDKAVVSVQLALV